jgi:hypothetical protein
MSLFKWLMLITAISLTESFIISKRINKQITSLPQDNTNRTTTTKNEEKSLQLSRMKRQSEDTLKAFVNITQAIPIKTVYRVYPSAHAPVQQNDPFPTSI